MVSLVGRVVQPGQGGLLDVLRQIPMGETESGGLAMPAPELFRTIMMSSIGTLARGLKGKFPTAAVNAAGEPKLLFHGTPHAFKEFDLSKTKPGLYGKGIYLTDDPSITSGYADLNLPYGRADVTALKNYAPNVRPAFVRIEKPFDMNRMYTKEEARQLINEAGKLRPMTGLTGVRGVPEAYKTVNVLEGDLSRETGKSNIVSGERLFQSIRSILGPDQTTQALQANGYDGITHIGGKISGGKPHRVYIAFDPKQVVSPFDPQLQSLAGETRQLLENRLKQE